MKLLFDANLAPSLALRLAEAFPGSAHVSACGDIAADDLAIWRYAQANGFAIVSKDTDFQSMSFVYGAPPKVIWMRVGNCPTGVIERALRTHRHEIDAFDRDDDSAILIVDV